VGQAGPRKRNPASGGRVQCAKKGPMGATNEDDSADVARVVGGDLEAFEGIVRRWQARLVGLAWRFCRDRAMAEDMAQEAFLKAYRSLRSFRGEAAFSTWLIAIALNTYRTWLRAEGPPLLTIDMAPVKAAGHSVLQGLQDEERTEALRRAVLKLPARYRDALIVYYFQDRDLSEASRILGIAEGTLKAHLHRGRELLRRRCAVLAAAPLGIVPEGN
jgi:RNA polymerase sigma-70 factor, ECF subfamily